MNKSRLDYVDDRYKIPLEIIDGGSGRFMGIIDEPNQAAPAAYVFNRPRRMLRTDFMSPARPGLVIRTPLGMTFLVATHGPSEMQGNVFKSFRLFEVTQQMSWTRRVEQVDPVTNLKQEDEPQLLGNVWATYEPEQRESFDRQFRAGFETARVLTNAPVMRDDLLNDMRVVRAEPTLGLMLLNLS